MIAFAGEMVPDGWMLCNGAQVERTKYPELFAAIGLLHGEGNRVSTFNLPDYRGRFLRGTDASGDRDSGPRIAPNPGGATGNKVGSIEEDGVGPHNHIVGYVAAIAGANGGFEYTNNPGFPNPHYTDERVGIEGNPTLRKETRPKNAGVNFIIKVR